eukprot:2875078-Rhodomonas_salina.1
MIEACRSQLDGGGIAATGGSTHIALTMMLRNTADGRGGAVRQTGGTLRTNDSWLHGNTAGGSGGGLFTKETELFVAS